MRRKARRIGFDELTFFNRQLASMARLDLSFPDGLKKLSEEVEGTEFRALVLTVHEDLEEGQSLSDALSRHHDVFSELYLGIVRAGEEGGDLASALEGLANYSESMLFLKQRIRAALTYPTVAIGITGAIMYFLLVGILPKFQDVFASLDIELPKLTKFYLSVATTLNENHLLVLGGLGLAVIAVLVMRRMDTGARKLRQFALGLPFYGRLLRQVLLLRFCETLRALLASNVSLVPALDLTAKTLGDNLAHQTVSDMRVAAEEGRRVSDVLKRNSIFPKTFVWKFALAEEQGTLEKTLGELSRYLREELHSLTARVTYLLEPFLIALVAILVGSMVLSVFLPIFTLQEKLAG
jgi:type IV pilus assembly protein PilC